MKMHERSVLIPYREINFGMAADGGYVVGLPSAYKIDNHPNTWVIYYTFSQKFQTHIFFCKFIDITEVVNPGGAIHRQLLETLGSSKQYFKDDIHRRLGMICRFYWR